MPDEQNTPAGNETGNTGTDASLPATPAVDDAGADAGVPVTQPAFFIVEVRCPRERYIRAGIHFMRGKQVLENVSEVTLAVLRADPCLIVVSAAPAAAPSGGADVQNPGNAVNTGSDVTAAEINAAIDILIARGEPQDFTKSGAPTVKAVSDELGQAVTKAQVDAARAERQESPQ